MVRYKSHYCTQNYYNDFQIRSTLWLKFKRQIRLFTTISRNHPHTRQLFRSIKSVRDEKRRHTCSKNWFTIHPFSMFWYYWKIIMVFVYIWVSTTDLFSMTRLESVTRKNIFFTNSFNAFFITGNTLYIVDIILTFFTGYVSQQSRSIPQTIQIQLAYRSAWFESYREHEVVLKKRKIATHYLKRFFFVDIITVGDLILTMFGDIIFKEYKCCYNLIVFRFVRFARFYTAAQTVEMLLDKFYFQKYVYYIFVCLFTTAYSVMIFACLQIVVPLIVYNWKKDVTLCFSGKIKKKYDKVGLETNQWILFIHALHDTAATLSKSSSCNFNKCTSAQFVSTLTLIFAFFIHGWFLALVILVLNTRYKPRLVCKDFLKDVECFMLCENWSKDAQRAVKLHMKNTLKTEMFQEQDIFETLEPRIRFEIFALSSMDLIRTCHLFEDLPNTDISSLALRLKQESYSPGQIIVSLGDPASCMYFIASGSVAVYNKFGHEMCHLGDGDYFGEVAIIHEFTKRNATVITIEFSELYRLDIKDFKHVVRRNSRLMDRILRGSINRTPQSTIKLRRTNVYKI